MTKKLFTMASALVLAIGVSAFASGDDNKACADKQCGSQCQASATVCADAACCDPFEGLNLTPEQMMRLNTITTECRDSQKAAKCCNEGKTKCSKDSCGKAKCSKEGKEGKCCKEGKAKCCKEGKGQCCKEGKVGKCAKDSCGKARCKEAKADSCAARKRVIRQARMRGAAANAEATSEYLAKVKEVLTPEQYVQFLENCVTRGATMSRMFDRPGGVKYRDPKTGRAIPTGRDGMMLQRPRPVPADSCATASAPSCCSKE